MTDEENYRNRGIRKAGTDDSVTDLLAHPEKRGKAHNSAALIMIRFHYECLTWNYKILASNFLRSRKSI